MFGGLVLFVFAFNCCYLDCCFGWFVNLILFVDCLLVCLCWCLLWVAGWDLIGVLVGSIACLRLVNMFAADLCLISCYFVWWIGLLFCFAYDVWFCWWLFYCLIVLSFVSILLRSNHFLYLCLVLIVFWVLFLYFCFWFVVCIVYLFVILLLFVLFWFWLFCFWYLGVQILVWVRVCYLV